MTTFVTIIFITVSLVLIVSILLQAGRGGGLSAGLGGASQGVFGGGGGGDFMSRLTQAFAGIFMVSAVYLAYEGAHTGSEFLQAAGQEEDNKAIAAAGDIDWENLVPSALPLPESGATPQPLAPAAAPPTEVPSDAEQPAAPSEAPALPPPQGEADPAAPAPQAVEGGEGPAKAEPSAAPPSPTPSEAPSNPLLPSPTN